MGIIIGQNLKDYPNGHPVWIDSTKILYYPNGFTKAPDSFEAHGLCKLYNSVPRPESVKQHIAMIPHESMLLPADMMWEPFGFRIMFVPAEDCRIYAEMN